VRTFQRVVIAIGLAAVVAALLTLLPRSSSPKNTALAAREQATRLLGEQVAKTHPGCQVLVLSNPFTKKSGYFDEKAQFERAGLDGLRKGLGRSRITIGLPEIKQEYFTAPGSIIIPPDCRTPLSFLMCSAAVDQLVAAHPECSVIVSLVGLPVGVDQEKIWHSDDPRCFALLLPDLRLLGPPERAAEAFQKGKILAAVADDSRNPGSPLVITRENVLQVLKEQPGALGY
jgi:hypothetical protein